MRDAASFCSSTPLLGDGVLLILLPVLACLGLGGVCCLQVVTQCLLLVQLALVALYTWIEYDSSAWL
jgi:hypothetical protein